MPDIKASRIAATGAEVVKTGRVYADAERAARAFAAGQGRLYVHAYDDPAVVAGQGTLAAEIVADLPECDVVAVPVGGGGLLAGVSGGLAALGRPTVVVGVEPEGCPTLHAAVEAGEPVDVGADSVAASALGASRIGGLALAAYRANPVGLALVSDKEIIAARDRLWEEFRLAVEPGRRHRLRRLALRPGAGRPPVPGAVRRQRHLDARLSPQPGVGVRRPPRTPMSQMTGAAAAVVTGRLRCRARAGSPRPSPRSRRRPPRSGAGRGRRAGTFHCPVSGSMMIAFGSAALAAATIAASVR